MKIPVILHTWKKETGIDYFYPKEITSDHIMGLMQGLGANHPIHKSISAKTQNTEKFIFNNSQYICWWVAQRISATKECESYTRIVFAITPENKAVNNSLDFEKLWVVDDNLSSNQLFIEVIEEPMETYTQEEIVTPAIEKPQEVPKEKTQEIPKEEPVFVSTMQISDNTTQVDLITNTGKIKEQAAGRGMVIFSLLLVAAFVSVIVVFFSYIFPALDTILERSPFFKSKKSFLTLAKKSEIKCDFGTPVYDGEFNKLGVVNQQSDQDISVMLFSDHQKEAQEYNHALLYYQPRKLVAVFKLIMHSAEGKKVQKEWQQAKKELGPTVKKMMDRIIQIIQENYPLDVQKKLFKVIYQGEFSDFITAPVQTGWKKLQGDLEEYKWTKLIKTREVKKVKSAFMDQYEPGDMIGDGFDAVKYVIANKIFQRDIDLSEKIGGIFGDRVEKIVTTKSFKKVAKKSAHKLLFKVTDKIKLTRKGSFMKGKHAQELKQAYGEQAARFVLGLKQRGVNLAQEQIIQLWKKLQDDSELQIIWREQMEPKLQKRLGKFMKLWIDQFFPDNIHNPSRLQVLATALMREMLYGKPETVVVLTYENNTKKRLDKKIPLVIAENF